MIINPEKIFGNFYDDPNISNHRLLRHGTWVQEALQPAFPDLAGALEVPLNAFREELGGHVTARAVLKGRTSTGNDYIDAYLDTMRQTEGALVGRKISKGHPVYTEFFPQGLGTYNDIDRGNAEPLMLHSASATTTHAALLDPELLAELAAFPAGWQRVREAQLAQQGQLKGRSVARSAARDALELQLCACIHAVGLKFPGNAEKCAAFFNFPLLYAPGRKKNPVAEAG